MSIDIQINGNLLSLDTPINILALLIDQGYKDKLVAVAINGEFVPRESYNKHMINNQDDIEIVAPMQGG